MGTGGGTDETQTRTLRKREKRRAIKRGEGKWQKLGIPREPLRRQTWRVRGRQRWEDRDLREGETAQQGVSLGRSMGNQRVRR